MCTSLMLATLETIRQVAAAPQQTHRCIPAETTQLISSYSSPDSPIPVFAPPGQHLPVRPEERQFLNCLSLAGVDPDEAIRALPARLRGPQAAVTVWAMAELFRSVCMEHAASLRARTRDAVEPLRAA